jgi:hypothetical protein
MLAALLLATAAATVAAAHAPARSNECEAVGRVCLGTLPSSHTRVALKSRNGSGERGIAGITLGFHETKVVFRLSGAPRGVRQAVNIFRGGCSGRILRRLGSIVNGAGVARADPMNHLSGYAVAVHESTAPGARIVACGAVPPKRG